MIEAAMNPEYYAPSPLGLAFRSRNIRGGCERRVKRRPDNLIHAAADYSNSGNCFGPNFGSDGKTDSTTTDPPTSPTDQPVPGFIAKKNCSDPGNYGTGDPQKEAVLVACAEQVEGTSNGQNSCDWFNPPPKPGSAAARRQAASDAALGRRLGANGFPTLPKLCTLLGGDGGTLTCGAFADRI